MRREQCSESAERGKDGKDCKDDGDMAFHCRGFSQVFVVGIFYHTLRDSINFVSCQIV